MRSIADGALIIQTSALQVICRFEFTTSCLLCKNMNRTLGSDSRKG
jgi:hypothetical protein